MLKALFKEAQYASDDFLTMIRKIGHMLCGSYENCFAL